jgi:hypothetical protein
MKMEMKDRCIILKSSNTIRLILYLIVFIGLPVVLSTNKLNIIASLVIQLLYSIIAYITLLGDYNDFYFYSRKVRINNKLKFWSPNVEYFYDEIDKIVVNNKRAAYNETNIKLYLKSSQKKRFGYSGLNKVKLKKIVKKFAEGGFDIEYYE